MQRRYAVRWQRWLAKWTVVTMALLVVLAGVVAGVGGWVLSRSLPPQDGLLSVTGLSAPVEIVRDSRGVPTIRAKSEQDAYFALGFAHAQDRLWQMETTRRLGAGRLAELLGKRALASDRIMRVFGLYQLAERSVAFLSAETRAALEAYAAGVNAWINNHPGILSPEFLFLAHTPAPWRPADSLVWGRLMAMSLGGDWMDELARVKIADGLPQADELWPSERPEQTVITLATPFLSSTTLSEGSLHDVPLCLPPTVLTAWVKDLQAIVPQPVQSRLASNAWVLDGRYTVSGKPLLANDPHLSFSAPILWYLARIETPTLILAGATVPGVPFHILGHNGHVTWGLTATHADTQDVFVERVVDEAHYTGPNGPLPFLTRTEVLQVRSASPVSLLVRTTRHGPVISDVLDGGKMADGYLLALASTAFVEDDRTPEAFYRLNHANTWEAFHTALTMFIAPVQNVVYADIIGTIAFMTAGRIPVRAGGNGAKPACGWDGSADWVSWLPEEYRPLQRDPGNGRLINANNPIVPPDYPFLITATWPDSFRARRISTLLDHLVGKADMAAMVAVQTDTVSLFARTMIALLTDVPVVNEAQRKALEKLRAWDGRMDRDQSEPLLFTTWALALKRAIFSDELKERFDSWNGLRPMALFQALTTHSHWCDDVDTSHMVETCPQQAAQALAYALALLEAHHGEDHTAWRWGAAHKAIMEHALFKHFPVLDRLSRRIIATDGDDSTVNRGSFDSLTPPHYLHRQGAGLRAVYDLANLDNSQFVIATGQSGHFLSPHYDDLLQLWRDGQLFPMAGNGERLLLLVPQTETSPPSSKELLHHTLDHARSATKTVEQPNT